MNGCFELDTVLVIVQTQFPNASGVTILIIDIAIVVTGGQWFISFRCGGGATAETGVQSPIEVTKVQTSEIVHVCDVGVCFCSCFCWWFVEKGRVKV